jgi:hypothetical protein
MQNESDKFCKLFQCVGQLHNSFDDRIGLPFADLLQVLVMERILEMSGHKQMMLLGYLQ